MDRMILELVPRTSPCDYWNVISQLSAKVPVDLSGFTVHEVPDVVSCFKQDIIEFVKNNGVASLFKDRLIEEEFLPKSQPLTDAVIYIQCYLDDVIKQSTELIIIDPYFYAKSKLPDYASLVHDILSPYLATLNSISIITSTHSKYIDPTTKNGIESKMRSANSNLVINHKTSDNFHDRFWISSNRTKGMLLGTSLNSLGNKHTLVDSLDDADVKDIVAELVSENLI